MKHLKHLTLLLALALPGVAAMAQGSFKKVKFIPGYTQANEKGSIAGYAYKDFKVDVAPGQTLIVTLKTASKAASFNVHPPNSPDSAMFIGAVSGKRFARQLDERGEYTIRVSQNRASARRNEVANFTLNIRLTGGASANDSLVKGTPYHATGVVRAARGNNPFGTENATFGVIRRGLNEADIHLTLTGGKKREIRYSQGRFACMVPKGCKVMAERQGVDNWHVIINGSEHYLIPDVIISGD